MRKLFVLLAVFTAAFGLVIAPTAAQSSDALTSLAAYFPDTTAMYIAARTDDDFIATLDTVVGKLADALPAGALPVSSARELLNFASMSIDSEGDFDSVFRSWLGDSLALGVLNFDMTVNTPPILLAVNVTDLAGAEMYLESQGVIDGYTRTEEDGVVLLSPRLRMGDQPFVILRDNVLLLGLNADNVESLGVQAAPLSDSATFADTLDRLPADSYNAVIYSDTTMLLDSMMSAPGMAGQPMPPNFEELLGAIGPQVYGATIIDGRALTIDLVATYRDMDALMAMSGVDAMPVMAPVDPALAAHVMAGTPLVILASSNTGAYPLDQLDVVIEMYEEQGLFTEDDAEQARQALFLFETGVRGLTGMEPEEAFSVFSGDLALTLGLSAAASDASSMDDLSSSFPLEFAVVVLTDNPENATRLVNGLETGLADAPLEGLLVAREEMGDANALSITVRSKDIPFPINLAIAESNGVFAFGTTRSVEFALNPTAGAGLDSDPAYIEALETVLPDAVTVLYAAGEGFQPLARVLQNADRSSDQRDGATLGIVLDLISSSSISAGNITDNGVLARMVWTLPE